MPSAARILVVLGTRPEAIKLAPVIGALRDLPGVAVRVAVTAQHRALLDDVLAHFALSPDVDLDLMRPDQAPAVFAARAMEAIDALLADEAPDLVVAQGDTTTVMAASLCCHYRRVPLAHVEAGLRTHRRDDPFPEELHRVVAGYCADLHLAPTDGARAHLLREGVPPESVVVTGNPGIDALLWTAQRAPAVPAGGRRTILVTAHRRESFGAPLRAICDAVADVVAARDVRVLWPVHPNPEVGPVVRERLGAHDAVELVPPLDYPDFVAALRDAHCVLTDSGGVQEEAPALGVPALVLRAVTERVEAVDAGAAVLVGVERDGIVRHTLELLDDAERHARMAEVRMPFGDGHAAVRIAATVASFLGLTSG